MVAVRPLLPCLVLCPLLWWCGIAAAATFTATVDRKELFVNEHVVLTLALSDSETRLRAEGVEPNIDLTVLTGQFEFGSPRADFRFNIDRNRGRSTSSITVALFPRRSGRLTIPVFSVDGMRTDPIVLRVLDADEGTAAEVFAVSGIDRRTLHVREQTRVWIDLYHRVSLDSARLGGPVDSRPRQVELHLLPQDNRVEEVNGLEYQVTRTAWAISPLSGDEITIFLPDIWIETREGRQWRLPFSEERIAVAELPAAIPAGTLINRPALEVSAPALAEAGRMTPWEITLRTTTALNALPVELPFQDHAGELRIFMDPPERRLEIRDDGLVESVAVYRGSVMPLTPGDYTLPAIELPWFDPDQGGIALLSVPGPSLRVTGSPVDIDDAAAFAFTTPASRELRVWQSAAVLLLLAWMSTLALWWRRAATSGPGGVRGTQPDGDAGADIRITSPLRDRLLSALGSRTLEQGLRRRESTRGVDEELRAVVRDVQRRCYHQAGHEGGDPELAERVDRVVDRLRREPPRAGDEKADKWSPRAFHPAGRDEQ
jgi:hypothetical protein